MISWFLERKKSHVKVWVWRWERKKRNVFFCVCVYAVWEALWLYDQAKRVFFCNAEGPTFSVFKLEIRGGWLKVEIVGLEKQSEWWAGPHDPQRQKKKEIEGGGWWSLLCLPKRREE